MDVKQEFGLVYIKCDVLNIQMKMLHCYMDTIGPVQEFGAWPVMRRRWQEVDQPARLDRPDQG